MKKPLPTPERLRELLDYDSTTGHLYWKVNRGKAKIGQRAGCPKSNGYRHVSVDGVLILEHRAVWAIVKDQWPEGDLDHIDRNPSNNRISNLRKAPRNWNRRPWGVSGRKGVYRKGSRWIARICICDGAGTLKYLGSYPAKCIADAVVRREAKKLGLHS